MNKYPLCIFVFFPIILLIIFFDLAWGASTWSFTNTAGRGTHPKALTISNGYVSIDLSSLPSNTIIYRAILVPNRKGNTFHYSWNGAEKRTIRVEYDGETLPLIGPRYLTLDATNAVREAISKKQKKIRFRIVDFPFLGKSNKALYQDNKTGKPVIRLDVTSSAPAIIKIPPVKKINTFHRDGGTLIQWQEPTPILQSNDLTSAKFDQFRKADENPHEIRYRVYRSNKPITQDNIGHAELVGQTDSLSVWDWRYFGHGHDFNVHSKGKLIPRYPVRDGVLANYDSGIFVYSTKTATEHAYYAVSRSIDGAEDFSTLQPGMNSSSAGLRETPGSGLVLLRQKSKKKWRYIKGVSTLEYYVKWEDRPRYNIPQAFDYLVVTPEKKPRNDKPPLSVALHAWGGSIDRGWLWSYNLNKYGAIHVSTNQHPYDWWTGFHENLNTLKPLTHNAGRIRPFTQNRIRSFLDDFIVQSKNVDRERILLHGNSMGGSGTSLWGLKEGDYFANLTSMVGVHIPSETPQFVSSFDNVYGDLNDLQEYENSGLTPWDYENNVRWLRDHLTTETPHISFSNGKNDNGIGWSQAWKFTKTLIETKRPFTFNWGQKGHDQRPYHMGDVIDFQLHQMIPAFANGTLDDDLGDTPQQGSVEGQINYYYLWKADSIVDTSKALELTIFLRKSASLDYAEVDLTPRRIQKFTVTAGQSYYWKNEELGEIVQTGIVIADSHGFITLPTVVISKNKNHITITPAPQGSRAQAPQRLSPDLISLPLKQSIKQKAETASASHLARDVTVSNIKELLEAFSRLRSNMHILLEDGEYLLPHSLIVGSDWRQSSSPLQNVIIEAKNGEKGKVTLSGPGMMKNREPKTLLHIKYSRGVTLRNITLKDAYFHLVQIHGEDDADGVHLDKVTLLDAGQQLVKASRDSRIRRYADNGLIENSSIGFTHHARYSSDISGGTYYTNGIDVLGGSNWIIRNNNFHNIRAPHDSNHPDGITGSAILMWHQAKNTRVENNRFYECDSGISFGLTAGKTPDHIGGVISDNYIFRKGSGDVGISLNNTRDILVKNNTVLLHQTFPWTIEERRLTHDQLKPSLIQGNCVDGPIKIRDHGVAVIENTLHDCEEL